MKKCFAFSVFWWSIAFIFPFLAGQGVDVMCGAAAAEEMAVLKGAVSDTENNAVEGAMVFVYDSTDVRRPADFISARTDKNGLFRLFVPPGKYWAVARLKKTEGYGPLMPGDRHSGEPAEFEAAYPGEVSLNFIVADLKEAIKAKVQTRERPSRIGGRIVDRDGTPITGAYAVAHRNEQITGIPDHLSASVDDDGQYTLYLPRGTYYIGAALTFPPGNNYFMRGAISVDSDRDGVTIMREPLVTK